MNASKTLGLVAFTALVMAVTFQVPPSPGPIPTASASPLPSPVVPTISPLPTVTPLPRPT